MCMNVYIPSSIIVRLKEIEIEEVTGSEDLEILVIDIRYQAAHQGNEKKWREGEKHNETKEQTQKLQYKTTEIET